MPSAVKSRLVISALSSDTGHGMVTGPVSAEGADGSEGGSDAESSTPCGCRISSFVTAMRRSERSASRSSLSVMRSAPAVRPGIS